MTQIKPRRPERTKLERLQETQADSAASAAQMLQFLAMVVSPAGVGGVDPQIFHFANGTVDIDSRKCQTSCLYSGIWFSMGDTLDRVPTGRHHVADQIRESHSMVSNRTVPKKSRIAVKRVFGRMQLKGRRETNENE